ncbi:MAG TPA: ATP-binding protein [Phycisphaerae bacterium]|nr:ATP-binding protein [Phycisphaerae bacterium]HOJ75152.1 ATP-binding protein [Phycisphaerae bacterium]HOM52382.1 ATP-binding protein [Phycisphaerae bacterium]HON66250.1 ATP-binding protein [Phycisphaerae bacterium]HOQ85167.1 ATP-binding protein [Phycisphaerae bacterium]
MTTSDSPRFERPWQVNLTSDTDQLAGLRDTVAEAARLMGFNETAVAQIVLAIHEAIMNVIRHGYDGRPGQPIEVVIEPVRHKARRALQITIRDCGRQVDPESIVGRDLNDVRPGGLGTHIIRNVMDEVEYSIRQPRGMSLRMVKALATDRPEA